VESSYQNIWKFFRQKLENFYKTENWSIWFQQKIHWIPKMSFDKTVEETVPIFHKNVAHNPVEYEIKFYEIILCFQNVPWARSEHSWQRCKKLFPTKVRKITKKQKTVQALKFLQSVTLDK